MDASFAPEELPVQMAAATGHVLVCDLGLPDGDGYEFMRHMRANRSVPGIAMSGYGMDEDRRRSREAVLASIWSNRSIIYAAYSEAIRLRYLWHEFGDLNLIL